MFTFWIISDIMVAETSATVFFCFVFAKKPVYFSCSRKKRYQKKRATLPVDGLSVAVGDGIVRT